MHKKTFIATCLILLCQLSWAETCPSVTDIQKNSFKGWQAYDSEDGKPLSPQRLVQFKKYAKQFALAEWPNESKNHSIRCYYHDKSGSDVEAYLAKDNFTPKNNKKYWYSVTGSMQCAAGTTRCEFMSNALPQQTIKNAFYQQAHLAKK